MTKQKTLLTIAMLMFFIGIIFLLNNDQQQNFFNDPSNDSPAINKKLAKGYFTLYSTEQEFMKTRDPETNEVPANIKSKQLAFVSKLPKTNEPGRNQTWTHRGPFNVGGRMLCVAYDVTDETHMLAGSASGGMWQSANSGGTWEKVTPAIGEQSATCIAQDKRDSKTHTWYYGTGEILNTTDRNVTTNVGQ
ncbi:MAG: hypothetical protein B6I19_06185 [Bacteroidetes bacterium 4572_114]|nr:MAG: hypothetical protein B6I19_06185 [Bacteroidetes bacterium 4572_114]